MNAVLFPLLLANFLTNTPPNETKITVNSYPAETCSKAGVTVSFDGVDCLFGRDIYLPVGTPTEHKLCVFSNTLFDKLYLRLWELFDRTKNYGEGDVTPLLEPPVNQTYVGQPCTEYCLITMNSISNEFKKKVITFSVESILSHNGVEVHEDSAYCDIFAGFCSIRQESTGMNISC